MATVMIKPGLSMVTGGGANSLVRVTDDGIVVVNTKNRSQASYDAFMAQIKMISDKPIKYAVVVDVHQDKSGNAEIFTAQAFKSSVTLTRRKTEDTNAAGTLVPECHL
jgi:hypothetical protein